MIHLERELRLRAPVQKIWPLISDTERINRATGLPAVQYRAEQSPSSPARMFAQTKIGPMVMQWQEYPFEWVQEDYFQARRCFSGGFLKEIRPGVKLLPEDGGTRVKVTLDFEARGALGAWIARHVLAPSVFRKFEKIFRGMDAHLQKDNAPNPLDQRGPRSRVDKERLRVLTGRLKRHDVSPDLADLLRQLLQNAPDIDVAAMRPFQLADCWKKDRIEVLKMFLHATKEGLVDLSWEVLCPHCRKPNVRAKSLSSMCCEFHCEVCQIKYDASFDQSVEARFTPHPSVREVPRQEFCAGGPGNTPHILARVLVPAGQKRAFSLRAECRPLKVRSSRQEGSARVIVREAGNNACAMRWEDGAMQPAECQVRSGMVDFELQNSSGQEQWFVVERESWDIAAATAAQVTSLQEFRDMFSSEVLAPGTEIAVRNLTFLFTDLAGSTATYHALGDAKAYSVVREHFAVLKDVIAKHQGAVVKTIGDAVMAVFYSPRQGVLAALEMQEAIARWCAERKMEKPLVLKIGLHEGPSIAVNTDNILDYFGTSVNLAARVESLSAGADIVVSDAVMQGIDQEDALQEKISQKEKLESPVKGFPKPVRAWRIKIPEAISLSR